MKILIKLLTLLAVLCAVACSQTFENESNSNLFSNQNAKAKGQLAMNIAEASRTITNILTNTDIHSAELTANGEVVGNWSGEDVINQIESDSSITLDVGDYDFVLSVKNEADETLATAETSKTISGGKNYICFYLESVATGTGSFEVTFSWQSEDVSSVKAGLYDCETAEEIEGYEAAALTISEKTAVYAKEEVPVGQYMLMVKFYDDSDNLLKSYTEVLQVEVYGKTTATKTFTGFNTVYSVTYVLPDGETWKEDFTPVTNRKTFEAVELPTIENINTENDISVYTLKWYTTETFDVGTEIVKINAGTEKDMTVYAKIDDCCRTTVEGFVDTIAGLADGGPYNVIVTGELTAEALTTMVSSMKANSAKMINLDLSGTTGLTSIGEDAFYNCRNLTSVVIPDSVISIGEGAFGDCSSLSSVVIPDSVTSIDKNAFSACSGLTSVAIPGSVTSIGNYAFCNCSSLTSIEVDSANPVFSSSDDGKMLLSKDKTTLIEYPSAAGEVTIPAGVSIINSCAFKSYSNITSVVIPEGVTSIGDDAFGNCSSLTSITIPGSVEYIGSSSAFYDYDSLESVHISDLAAWCNIEFKDHSANPLAANGAKLYLNGSPITDLVIPNGVESINSYAFYYYNSLTSVTIGDSVTSIGDDAFSLCDSLTSVTIGDSVTSIGDDAFSYCGSLTSVTIGKNVSSIGYHAFSGCFNLASVTIPDSVTSIGNLAFENCSRLTSVTLPDSVTSIGDYAFRCCSSLTSVTIGDSVTSISQYAFEGCSSLTSVVIPDSVTSIGQFAFEGCSSLTSVTIGKNVSSIGYRAFYNCDNLKSVTFKNTNNWYYTNRFNTDYTDGTAVDVTNPTQNVVYLRDDYSDYSWCSIELSDEGNIVFNKDKTELISYSNASGDITIPDGVKEIRYGAFENCSGLTSVTLPNSVTSIGNYAFVGCDSLESVHISDLTAWCNIEFADYSANPLAANGAKLYLNGSPVTDFVIPNGVESINSYAFTGNGLTSVTIPDSVTSIDQFAFSRCSSLTSVVIPDSVTSIGDYAFEDCSSLTSVTIPDSVTSIVRYAFSGCSSLSNVAIPDSVTTIGPFAFRDCSSLTSVAIPDSVTSIDSYAFSGCSGLESVYISDLTAWCNIEFENSSANPLNTGAKLYLNGDLAEFTVKFDVTGGILTGEASQIVTSGEKVAEPTDPSKTGYVFYGWYTSADDGQTLDSAYNFDTVLTKNITLYAKWIDETVGYIAYSDGTISADYDSAKTPVGIVIEATDGTATKIVSLTQTSAKWSTEDVDTNATSETDGMANMTAIQSISGWEEKYPAFKWCDDYTDASDNSEWYLPAKDELDQLYSVKDVINTAIEKITAGDSTATSFDTGNYWSSSQFYDGNFEAWTQSFSAGDQYGDLKDIARSVRAVRAF